MSSFQGKVIAITGGASGMGLSIARILHERGAKISIADWSEESLKNAPAAIGTDDIVSCKCDVRDLSQVRAWINETVDKFGKLDGAANFAGIISSNNNMGYAVADQDEDDWEKVIGVNLTGLMHSLKEELKYMKKGAAIVNAASIAGVRGLQGTSAYGVSKHGVIGLTKICAKDYGPKGIRVNAVAPGFVDTPMLRAAEKGREGGEKLTIQAAAQLPLARTGHPDEVAKVAIFLLSDESSYMSGQIVSVDGGWNV